MGGSGLELVQGIPEIRWIRLPMPLRRKIKWNYDATLGFAQYLDFRNPSSLPANTRLNTTHLCVR